MCLIKVHINIFNCFLSDKIGGSIRWSVVTLGITGFLVVPRFLP